MRTLFIYKSVALLILAIAHTMVCVCVKLKILSTLFNFKWVSCTTICLTPQQRQIKQNSHDRLEYLYLCVCVYMYDCRFDLLVLGIGLSINLCEHSSQCRQTLLDTETVSSYDSICESESMTADEALLLLFHQR